MVGVGKAKRVQRTTKKGLSPRTATVVRRSKDIFGKSIRNPSIGSIPSVRSVEESEPLCDPNVPILEDEISSDVNNMLGNSQDSPILKRSAVLAENEYSNESSKRPKRKEMNPSRHQDQTRGRGEIYKPSSQSARMNDALGVTVEEGSAEETDVLTESIDIEPLGHTVTEDDIPVSAIRSARNRRTSNATNEYRNEIDVALSRPSRELPARLSDINHEDLITAYNDVKGKMSELRREKRVYISAYHNLLDRNQILQKEVKLKNQQLTVMEENLQARQSRRGSRNLKWSADKLKEAGLENYHAVLLMLDKYGKKEADLVVREIWIDTNDNDRRKRDWRGSFVPISTESDKKNILIRLPDGRKGIATCVMERAMKPKMYTCPFQSMKEYANDLLKKVLSGSIGKYLDTNEKEECIAKLTAHQATLQKLRCMITTKDSSRKRSMRDTYLHSLGYCMAATAQSKKETNHITMSRIDERKVVRERCTSDLRNGVPNTTFWRLSEWKNLCMDDVDRSLAKEMEEGENAYNDEGVVDNLFMNHAARLAFQELQGQSIDNTGSEFDNDVSILTLARADGCITNSMKHIIIPGKGGNKNTSFKESFKSLLLLSMDRILSQIWRDLNELDSYEFTLRIRDEENNEDDPYGNHSRNWTVVVLNQRDNYLYLFVTPNYFRERICSWIGNVKDVQIGRCKPTDEKFEKISSAMTFDTLEESDIDEIVEEED